MEEPKKKKIKIHPNSLKNIHGRRKGVKNRIPRDMAAVILEVFNELQRNPAKNKKTALIEMALDDPKWFYELIKNMLPKDIFIKAEMRYQQMTPEELDAELLRLIETASGSEDPGDEID